VTYVTQHRSKFDKFARTYCSQRQPRINASGFPHQLSGNHHVQALAHIVLVKDDIANHKLNTLRRCI